MAGKFGYAAIILGLCALTMTVVHFFGGPFAPQQSAGVSLGELTAEIAQSAKRSVLGQPQPAPATRPWDTDRIVDVAAPVLAVFALALAVFAYVQHEPRRLVVSGIALGSGALLFQFFAWYALALIGVLLIYAMMDSLGEFFSGLFS